MSEISDYDRAISAYQFQVERYHTWMNYYSLFHGALLAALYSVIKDTNDCSSKFLISVICFVGFVAGLCWLGTVIGNMTWMNKWMEIIKDNEKEQNKCYSQSGENIENKEFLSTQKIMRFFVSIVCAAWAVIPVYILKDSIYCTICYLIFVFAILGYALHLYYSKSKYIHS